MRTRFRLAAIPINPGGGSPSSLSSPKRNASAAFARVAFFAWKYHALVESAWHGLAGTDCVAPNADPFSPRLYFARTIKFRPSGLNRLRMDSSAVRAASATTLSAAYCMCFRGRARSWRAARSSFSLIRGDDVPKASGIVDRHHCFDREASLSPSKSARDRGRGIAKVRSAPSLSSFLPFFFFFFAHHFRIDFYQKYMYIYICISVYVRLPPLSAPTLFPPWRRRRSPAQRSSLTYGYTNDQGTLDGSDMESLGRRYPPSESTGTDILSPSHPQSQPLRIHRR